MQTGIALCNLSLPFPQIVYAAPEVTLRTPDFTETAPLGTIATQIIRTRLVPGSALFLDPASTQQWLRQYASTPKRSYEAAATAAMLPTLASQHSPIILAGLGIGKGIGEIEIVKQMLAAGLKVHYMPIDSSPAMLMAHIDLLRRIFPETLGEQLYVLAILGNFLDMSGIVRKVKELTAEHTPFIPEGAPAIVTLLGNNIGNNPGREDHIFIDTREAFANHPLGMAIGISVDRGITDPYDTLWFGQLLLRTPDYIARHTDYWLITRGRPEAVFRLPTTRHSAEKRISVVRELYQGDTGIVGACHYLQYKMPLGIALTRSPMDRIRKGAILNLIDILKYDPDSIAERFQTAGFSVHQADHPVDFNLGARQVRQYKMLTGII